MKKLMELLNAKKFKDLVIELRLIKELDENEFYSHMSNLTKIQGRKVFDLIDK